MVAAAKLQLGNVNFWGKTFRQVADTLSDSSNLSMEHYGGLLFFLSPKLSWVLPESSERLRSSTSSTGGISSSSSSITTEDTEGSSCCPSSSLELGQQEDPFAPLASPIGAYIEALGLCFDRQVWTPRSLAQAALGCARWTTTLPISGSSLIFERISERVQDLVHRGGPGPAPFSDQKQVANYFTRQDLAQLSMAFRVLDIPDQGLFSAVGDELLRVESSGRPSVSRALHGHPGHLRAILDAFVVLDLGHPALEERIGERRRELASRKGVWGGGGAMDGGGRGVVVERGVDGTIVDGTEGDEDLGEQDYGLNFQEIPACED